MALIKEIYIDINIIVGNTAAKTRAVLLTFESIWVLNWNISVF